MPAAFSRLQLAAALIEYDNDPDDPYASRRSAQESAIFAHLRQNPAAPPRLSSRQSGYLGVSLPSETESLGGRESIPATRRSRGSIDALRNPFGADSYDGENEDQVEENDMEVDLTSWGLDAFMPKDKSKKGKGKATSIGAAPSMTTVPSHVPSTGEQVLPSPRRAINTTRPMSLGGSLDFIKETTTSVPADFRRRSIGTPLDAVNLDSARAPTLRPRANSAGLLQGNSGAPQSVPFPTSSIRAMSPGPAESISVGRRPHDRTFSMASMNSKMLLPDVKEESIRSRPISTYDQEEDDEVFKEDNPFTLQPPSHPSRFDPKSVAHARTVSNASMGTRLLLADDHESVMTGAPDYNRERRYSTLELLRPKVLVMPSPLQSTAPTKPPEPEKRVRDGFMLSKDGPPLPPGARTSRTLSTSWTNTDAQPPIPSNSFTPNPLNDLSYTQKLFRNTLAVDGHEDAYPEGLPRATEDGEQIQLYPTTPEVEEIPLPTPLPESTVTKRLPGKLYGKSLIDDLEMRKAQMRSKQRVFTGDQRPSMMVRETRASTFIDPASLTTRPTSQFLDMSSGEGLTRRNSANIKPLLNFEGEKIPQSSPHRGRPPDSRSVFGVDTLWEREMAKLKEIEAQEKLEAEERQKREEEERQKAEKKNNKKRKGKTQEPQRTEQSSDGPAVFQPPQMEPKVSMEPPVLPVIERATRRPPPPPASDDDDEDEESEDEVVALPHQAAEPQWHAGSSDEEDNGPLRTTGVGPRYTIKKRSVQPAVEVDSDEDLPLVAAIHKALTRGNNSQSGRLHLDEDDEDEEKPLSSLLEQTKVKLASSSLLDVNFDKLSLKTSTDRGNNADADDDDDQPLGLRASKIPPGFNNRNGNDDDDDRPLAFHPEQQRRTQYGMLAQQQQQQMMMQAQLQNNMFFNPSMMGSGFFAPPMAPPMMNPISPMMMMQPPMPIPSPPPLHDAAKFGRVDKWRRDVAVEGER